MVKPVALEGNTANQFSEVTQTTADPNTIKDKNAKKSVVKPVEVTANEKPQDSVTENLLVKRQQEAEAKKTEEESAQELKEAFDEISEFMNLYNRNVNFSTDEKSEKTVIKVFDSDSQELIKQFPSEDLIELAHKIKELRQDVDLKSGIFLDEKV